MCLMFWTEIPTLESYVYESANSGVSVPFAKPNGANLPVNSGVSVNSNNNGTDDELTVVFPTLESSVYVGLIGKAQGFYVASSVDGNSQTMAFTAMFESGGYADSISFFGVHKIAVSESHLAIMGGTGKYLNAAGYAIVKTFPATNQHETDGFETLLQITVYLAY
ncbi:hypothetical protein REPUB_Repub05bG0159100 [Reevesia pubescens]